MLVLPRLYRGEVWFELNQHESARKKALQLLNKRESDWSCFAMVIMVKYVFKLSEQYDSVSKRALQQHAIGKSV